eukprot:Gregarina_sp_Poly_1__1725@NODE_1445_length_4132_cov_59_894711_g431_i1_p1_GENE_NODE_1445_length_4132_cov_59_894711_g431_i1NODE_1445_length_4132_cov_59_894711_g431_i1_p1_ORF_typecomplete_len399_score93_28HOOK/PF05622_12/2_2e03HOOK/PF05622_12/1_2e08AAA_13/PF13166_6/1_2e02AAA_13/PF13166_6/3_1e05BRE1/PF08647_11/84BRE1/PF08647_11/5_5e02BRE1/PF08647_11/0_00028DUF3584/PF12128_8/0_00088Rab5bind/PF09311_11/0_0033Filament/PF00038_21/26Filament/PF00038_21/0_11Filament/PF00038_21/0_00065ATG16/PF08614_11/4_6e
MAHACTFSPMEVECAQLLLELADQLDTLNDKLTLRPVVDDEDTAAPSRKSTMHERLTAKKGQDEDEIGGPSRKSTMYFREATVDTKKSPSLKETASLSRRASDGWKTTHEESFEEDAGSIDLSAFEDRAILSQFLQRMIDLIKDGLIEEALELENTLEADHIYIEALQKEVKQLKADLELAEQSNRFDPGATQNEFLKLQVELAEKTSAYDDLMSDFGVLEQQHVERERQTKALKILVEECKVELLDLRQERDQARAEVSAGFGSKEKVAVLEKQLAQEHQRYKALQEELEDKVHELEDVRRELTVKVEEIEKLANTVLSLEAQSEKAAKKINDLTRKQSELEGEKDKLQKSAGHMADDLKELQGKYDKLQERLERLGDVGPDPLEILHRQVGTCVCV